MAAPDDKETYSGYVKGAVFFYSTGSVRKLARDWTTGRSRGVVTQESSRSSQVVKSGKCCILSKKIISKQSIWRFKGDCDFLCYRLFPSTFSSASFFNFFFVFIRCLSPCFY